MKLLIIEDDNFFQKFYSSKLSEDGFIVEKAGNGEEGVTKAQIFSPDIILLDLIMPKMDGFEVLKSLKDNKALHTIPVIVFSTLGGEQDVQKALSLGASTFVNKSFFDYDKLKGTIATVLKK
jgi:CheY-like chemotaxis protein